MDSTANPNVKIVKEERIKVCSLAHNTSRVEGCAGTPRWD